MDNLTEILISKINERKLTKGTLKTYTNNFKNFKKNVGIELNSLEDIHNNIDAIITYINKQTTSIKRNYTNPLLMLLAKQKKVAIPEYQTSYDKLYNILNDVSKIYNDIINERELTKTQKDIFLDYDTIVRLSTKAIDDYYREPAKYNNEDLRDLVILGLYSYLPPRRSIYANTKIITMNKYTNLSENDLDNNVYLVQSIKIPKFFHYGRNIVKSRTQTNEIVEIKNPILIKLLSTYLKKHKFINMFVDRKNNPINSNYFGKLITNVFKKYHSRPLNVVLLRKIYLMKYSDEKNNYNLKDAMEDARSMNHSIRTQQSVYVKNRPTQQEEEITPYQMVELKTKLKKKFKIKNKVEQQEEKKPPAPTKKKLKFIVKKN